MVDMSRIRFIPGAPPGVCACLEPARFAVGEPCEECGNIITESDGEVWMCSSRLLNKKKGSLTWWHRDCLEPGPITVAFL